MRVEPVAITGMGAVSALGHGVNALWSGLVEGCRPFSTFQAAGIDACRSVIAGRVSLDSAVGSGCSSVGFAILAAKEAVSAAQLQYPHDRVGVVLGSTAMGDNALDRVVSDVRASSRAWLDVNKGLLTQGLGGAIDIGGPRTTINTACSSGTCAIGLACQQIWSGECDAVLAIGCDEVSRYTFSGFHALRALDPKPCSPFDRKRAGLTLGEGAGCLVLERLNAARARGARVIGQVLGFAASCDAYHLTAPDPTGHGAAVAMTQALRSAELDIEQVGFINAHGTGTVLNDAAEVAGIECCFGALASRIPVYSIKGNTGHTLGAAGAIEAIATLCSLRHGIIPPTAGLSDGEFAGRIDCVHTAVRKTSATYALSNSFGFGGNNASIVLAAPDVT